MKNIIFLLLLPFVIGADVNFDDLANVANDKLNSSDDVKKIMNKLNNGPQPVKQMTSVPFVDNGKLESKEEKSVPQEKKITSLEKSKAKDAQKDKPLQEPKEVYRQVEFKMMLDANGDAYYAEEGPNDYSSQSREKIVTNEKPIAQVSSPKELSSAVKLDATGNKSPNEHPNIPLKYQAAYEHLKRTSSLVDIDGAAGNLLNSIFQEFSNRIASDDGLTIFFFVDSYMDLEMFKRFSNEMSKIREINPNATGRILTNGLVITKEEKEALAKKIDAKQKEISSLDKKAKSSKLIELQKELQQLKYEFEGNFDSHFRWVKSLYENNINGVKVQFHPIAFKKMGIERVPAYLLSKCETDFKFSECENIAFVRGNISLASFFKLISDDNKEYLGYYEKLLK